MDKGNFIADLLGARLLDAVLLEGAFGSSSVSNIGEKHLIVDGPVLVLLLELSDGLNRRVSSGEVFPPMLIVTCGTVLGKFLSMNADSLLTKLICVLFNHLLATLGDDVRLGLGGTRLLLHAKVAHFTRIQSLLSILQISNVRLQGLQVN